MTVAQLNEKRAKLISDARSIYDAAKAEDRSPTAEERSRFDAFMADADAVAADIERMTRLENEERALNESRGRKTTATVETKDDELRSWLLNPNGGKFYSVPLEARAQSVGTATAGGHTVADEFVSAIEIALKAHDGIRSVAQVIRTETGAPLSWPTADDTSEEGALIAENTAAAENDVVFGNVGFSSFKFTSGLVKVSNELLQDSGVNVGQIIGDILGTRLGRVLNRYHTVGTGSAQPQGALTGASASGVVTADLGDVTLAELIRLEHSVDPAYRAGAVFMFNDKTLAVLKTMTDLQGRPLFLPSMVVGEPGTILGYKYVINQHMADLNDPNGRSIAFGHFGKVVIRDVRDVQIVRMSERYAELDQTAFVGWLRNDSRVLQPAAIKYLANAAE